MNYRIWSGLLLLAGSYAQLLFPRRLFSHPGYLLYGYPVVAGNLLAISTTLFTLGVIVTAEGVCERFDAPSLWRLATSGTWLPLRVLAAAAVAGLSMEVPAQWLARLWYYPYWTAWFYGLVVVPGFAFFWASIAESYLAVKAVLDAATTARSGSAPGRVEPVVYHCLGVLSVVLVGGAAWGYARWYAARGGYAFAVSGPVRSAPPFGYALVAFVGLWFAAEWVLHRRGLPSLVGGALHGYRVPPVALVGSALLLSVVTESQNAVHHYWVYAHLPGGRVRPFGVPLSLYAAWPLQYVVFLMVAGLLVPDLARLFWRRGVLSYSRPAM